MKIFQHIDVEQQQLISDKLYDYIVNHTNIRRKWGWTDVNLTTLRYHVPELFDELGKIIDHEITMVAILMFQPKTIGEKHVDFEKHQYRMLWPVRNCKGSYTKFYDLNGNKLVTKFGKQGERYLAASGTYPLVEVASVELIKPIVFSPKILHGVYTNPEFDEPRLTATIGFGDYPLDKFLE